MVGDEGINRKPDSNRLFAKKHNISFNNYPKWKEKLRENCFKRVRGDRTRLLWKFRVPEAANLAQSLDRKDFIKSKLEDIVSEELRKIKDSSSQEDVRASTFGGESDDMIWEFDGLHTAYQGDYEEILIEMQRIFYEELRMEETREPETYTSTWEDEEDEYLACAVFEHMQLNGDKVLKVVWCPICKQGELLEKNNLIYCNRCKLKLKGGDEVNLELLRNRLAEAHAEHLERGCRLKPEFCVETRFELTALYIKCQECNTFEIVI